MSGYNPDPGDCHPVPVTPNENCYTPLDYLECVTVCVDYSDFLEEAIIHNHHHFDEWVIVTHYNDRKTQMLCEKYGLICVQTDIMHQNGDRFNKGQSINLGLAHLRHKGWLLHTDADIILPDRFRSMLHKQRLQKEVIYGADRFNIYSHDKWIDVKNKKGVQFRQKCLVHPRVDDLELGSRLVHNEYGYCPIGYFQLWHGSQNRRYPVNQGSAEHTDVLFACQWRPHHRQLLPGVITYHLESERAKMGTNWNGRQTKPFRK